MSLAWLVTCVAAAVATLGAFFVPALIRLLPEPAPSSTQAEDEPKESYAHLGSVPGTRRAMVLATLALCACTLPLGAHPVAWTIEVLTPVLAMLAWIDLRTRLLPRIVVLPATGVVLALVVAEWAVVQHTQVLVRVLLGAVIARSFFWVLWFARRTGMGFGDVRLAALVGAVLGRVGWGAWAVGLYGGLLAFSLFGLGLVVIRRDRTVLSRAFPYGPFMIGGLYLALATSTVFAPV